MTVDIIAMDEKISTCHHRIWPDLIGYYNHFSEVVNRWSYGSPSLSQCVFEKAGLSQALL